MQALFLRCVATLAFAAGFSSTLQAAAPRYRIQDLGVLPGNSFSEGFGINNQGDVVGHSSTTSFPQHGQPFVRRDGSLAGLGTLGGLDAAGYRINDRGQVVGEAQDATGRVRPFLWQNGQMIDLAAPLVGAQVGRAHSINALGQVVGEIGEPNEAGTRAFVHDASGTPYLPILPGTTRSFARGLNDRGTIVGGISIAGDVFGLRTLVVRDGMAQLLPDPDWAVPFVSNFYGQDVNNAGQILVNQVRDCDINGNSFIYQDGQYTNVNFFDGMGRDLNERGWVVGDVETWDDDWGDFVAHAALYRDGTTYDLNNLLRPADAAHWKLSLAHGINDAGQIVGVGSIDGGVGRAFLAMPVPEPSTGALLGTALGMVTWVTRRRKAQTALFTQSATSLGLLDLFSSD